MKTKIIQLLSILKSITEEIEELKFFQAQIPLDRNYSNSIASSISEEINNLENTKKRLLDLEVIIEPLEANIPNEPKKSKPIMEEEKPVFHSKPKVEPIPVKIKEKKVENLEIKKSDKVYRY